MDDWRVWVFRRHLTSDRWKKKLWYSVERMVVAKMKEERPHPHLVAGKLSSHGSLCQQTSRLQSVVSNLDINNFLRIGGSSDDHM